MFEFTDDITSNLMKANYQYDLNGERRVEYTNISISNLNFMPSIAI